MVWSSAELDDETLVYDTVRDRAHCLNRTAALVWTQLRRKDHRKGKLSALCAASSQCLSMKTLSGWPFKQLEQFHLIEPRGKSPRVSRRKLMLKYAPLRWPAGDHVD